MNTNFLSGLLLVVFFIIRIILKFILEDDLEKLIIKHTLFDYTESGIIENGISLAFSFLTVGLIKMHGFNNLNLKLNPYLEFFSIFIATIFMLIIYESYKKHNGIKYVNRGFNIKN
jgi:hypothetical protein